LHFAVNLIGDNLTSFDRFSKLLNIDLNHLLLTVLILYLRCPTGKNSVNNMFTVTQFMVIN